MNERIRELYEQARLQAKSIDADLDPQGWMDLYHKKFAELIVKECAAHLHRRGVEGFGILEERNLKEHFGVKE